MRSSPERQVRGVAGWPCPSAKLTKPRLSCEVARNVAVWLCDRIEQDAPLAHVDALELDEARRLLGHPFGFFRSEGPSDSFLATTVADLTAFLGNAELYADIVNDFRAVEVVHRYWQVVDSDGLLRVDGQDIVQYASVHYADTLTSFDTFDFADHARTEVRSFRLAEKIGPECLLAMGILLRDRAFMGLWPVLSRRLAEQ